MSEEMFRTFQRFLKQFEQGKYDDILENRYKTRSNDYGIDIIQKYYRQLSVNLELERQEVQQELEQFQQTKEEIVSEIEKINKRHISKLEKAEKRKPYESQLKQVQEEMDKRVQMEEELNDELYNLDLKQEEAVAAARRNMWKELTAKEKAEIFKRASDELQIKLDQLQVILDTEKEFTEEEKSEYEELLRNKQMLDEKYLAVRKQQIMELSKEERLARYKSEAEEIAKNARLEKALAKKEAKDQAAYKAREKEINLGTKGKLKEAQEKYGITKSMISQEQTGQLLSGIGNLLGGKEGAAKALTETLFGEGGMIASSAAGGAGAAAGLSSLAGPIGIALTVLQTIAKVVGKINETVAKGAEMSANLQVQYMGPINTRLQGLSASTKNYYNEMIDWSADASDEFGLAIGSFNAFIDRQKYIEQLNALVQSGIAYNAEERALLQTMSDRLVTTFDVMDASLTRLVRLQQRDVTYAAMGSESLLTQFLNKFSAMGGIADTSYLNDVYDSVSATLLDAVAKLNADDATAFSYEVQKWLGALYSLGLSQEGVQSLAKGITYLQTGNVSELSSNQQLQYIYSAAAERAGLSIGDILIQGLDVNTTNALLQNVVGLLQDIYNNSSTNAVQSAWTSITGLSISDLKAMTNVTSDYMAYISREHQGWVSSWEETQKQIQMIQDDSRTSAAQAIQNIINNTLLDIGDKLTTESFQHNLVTNILGIDGMNKYAAYTLAGTLGGTTGSILQSMISVPVVFRELNDIIQTLSMSPEEKIARTQSAALPIDQQIYATTSSLYTLLDRLEKDRVIERQDRYAENLSMSSAIDNWNIAVESMQDRVNYDNLLITSGLSMIETIDTSINSGLQLNNLTRQLDEYSAANTSALVDASTSVSNQVESFASQANAVSEASTAITNQSSEDQQLLSKVADIQDYLFENESTIRVSLSFVEEPAAETIKKYTHTEEREALVDAILAIMRNKVPVDLIDNDVNTIVNNIYRTRYQY